MGGSGAEVRIRRGSSAHFKRFFFSGQTEIAGLVVTRRRRQPAYEPCTEKV